MTKLPPGKKLNAFVAKALFGLDEKDNKKNFSTNITDAWLIIERLPYLNSEFGNVRLKRNQTLRGTNWECIIDGEKSKGETAPHALCLTALKVLDKLQKEWVE